MKRILTTISLLGLAFPGLASARQSAPANSLTRARATFSAADANKDGRLSADESIAIPIGRSDFLAYDQDQDGAWSGDEFLIFYRQRLMLAGQQVGADLEAETARIQAVRKAKASEATKIKPVRAEGAVKAAQPSTVDSTRIQKAPPVAVVGSAPGANPPAASLADIEAGLQNALENLEKRAAAAQATREDFQRVHDQLVARARAAAKSGGSGDAPLAYGSEAYRKMLQSLDRLEKRANDGLYSRADYQEFRDTIIHRARLIAGQSATEAQGGQASISPELPAIERGLQSALDGLEKRAAAGHASREDFQQVRDQLIARARAAANPNGPQAADTYQKMMQALDRLEKRAGEGVYSRAEYQELRDQFIHRAREIQSASNAGAAGPAESRRQPAPPKSNEVAVQPQRSSGATEPVREPAPQPAPPRGSSEPKAAPKTQRPPPPPSDTPPKGEAKPEAQRPPPSNPPK